MPLPVPVPLPLPALARTLAPCPPDALLPAGKTLITADLSGMADVLETRITPLAAALDRVQQEEREAEVTQVCKDQATEQFDQVLTATAGLISALLQAAGEEVLARRVRPSTGRPGRTLDKALSTATAQDATGEEQTTPEDTIP